MKETIAWILLIGLIVVCLMGAALKPSHSEGATGKFVAGVIALLAVFIALVSL